MDISSHFSNLGGFICWIWSFLNVFSCEGKGHSKSFFRRSTADSPRPFPEWRWPVHPWWTWSPLARSLPSRPAPSSSFYHRMVCSGLDAASPVWVGGRDLGRAPLHPEVVQLSPFWRFFREKFKEINRRGWLGLIWGWLVHKLHRVKKWKLSKIHSTDTTDGI